LTKKHDGRYLASVTADCLKHFGLDKNVCQLLLFYPQSLHPGNLTATGICMDNASNCNKLAELLPDFLPDFWGMDARLRCLAHIFNLVAKVKSTFLIFYFTVSLKYC
jgi:hypothetical protein